MKVSDCCGALFYEPGWPENYICSACKEHANASEIDEMTEQEEASNRVLSKLEDLNKDNKGKIR